MTHPRQQAEPGLLVHGMGKELTEPDWPPLTDAEAESVLARYREFAGHGGAGRTAVAWRSPRPMSAAGLVRSGGRTVFVKRHDQRVRTARQLAAEHAFADHLRGRGLPVPRVLRTTEGASTVRRGRYVHEVHGLAAGIDLYRDATSWSPFASAGHAHAAGAELARLHRAAAGFRHPARPPGVLLSGCDIVLAADPPAAVGRLLARRPGLDGYLRGRTWPDDFARNLLPAIGRAGPLLRALPRQWGHGDWHPSNLSWTSAGPDAQVSGIFDLGLANRTLAVHDLATALERCTIGWLDLADTGQAAADHQAVDALLDGYQSVRPLSAAEARALPAALPVVHVEYALAEVEYFAAVLRSPAGADLAYDGYLIGHARWFAEPDGAALLGHLSARLSAMARRSSLTEQ